MTIEVFIHGILFLENCPLERATLVSTCDNTTRWSQSEYGVTGEVQISGFYWVHHIFHSFLDKKHSPILM